MIPRVDILDYVQKHDQESHESRGMSHVRMSRATLHTSQILSILESTYNSGIIVIGKGLKFRDSHILKILS